MLLWCWKLLASSEQTEQGSFKKKLTVINTAAAIVRNGCSPRLHGSRKLTHILNRIFFPRSADIWSSKGGGVDIQTMHGTTTAKPIVLVIQCRVLAAGLSSSAPRGRESTIMTFFGQGAAAALFVPLTVKVEQFNCSPLIGEENGCLGDTSIY